ncbi:MAG: hypothetical protein HMLKMBBP_01590 [Planctomycetes bacterium]|nr:hypothetical protein [Planctomycetota bacterium]
MGEWGDDDDTTVARNLRRTGTAEAMDPTGPEWQAHFDRESPRPS